MSELRECPFCGGEASVYESNRWPSSGDRITGYTVICTDMDCINYRADDWYERTEKRAIERWNTRYERTCEKVPGKMRCGERRPKCSECGYGLGDPRWEYCPSCGAKVTDLPTAIEDAIGEVIERYPNTMDMLGDE